LIGGLILSPVIAEFNFRGPFLSLAMNIGLFVGAVFWGLGCDIWGRRWSFNVTLLIAGIFGLAAGGSSNFLTLASLMAVLGVGVGGNLPVDSAVFLDFVPGSHQYLLTVLSIWWSLGQLFVNLVSSQTWSNVRY
jgi:MFS family permease